MPREPGALDVDSGRPAARAPHPARLTSGDRVQVAALLLLARRYLHDLGLPCPRASETLRATGASKSRSYELTRTLSERLVAWRGNPDSRDIQIELFGISRRVVGFLMNHPGAVCGTPARRIYSASFRRFALTLRADHAHVPAGRFADAIGVPLATFKLWSRGLDGGAHATRATSRAATATAAADNAATADGHQDDDGHRADQEVDSDASRSSAPARQARVRADAPPPGERDHRARPLEPSAAAPRARPPAAADLAWLGDAWQRWQGSFTGFCDHLRRDRRVPFRRTWIASHLALLGLRPPPRRRRRSPDELALTEAFATFFPGAQWVGDGTLLTVHVDGKPYPVHVELMVDADSGALVGASLGAREDSDAIVAALADATREAGARPESVLLDNHASNRSAAVRRACADLHLIYATRRRPQNKAHVEGAFGLLAQTAPALEVRTRSPGELAQQLARLTIQTWARTLNHRERRAPWSREGVRSRAQRYRAAGPGDEQRQAARRQLARHARRQWRTWRTRRARRDPAKRAFLDREFERLDIFDPTRRVRAAIARYPLDAVVAAVSVFTAQRASADVARHLEGRYLLGITRNITRDIEVERVVERLWQSRNELSLRLLEPLEAQRASICDRAPPARAVLACIDAAVAAERGFARLFWLSSAAALIAPQPRAGRERLFKLAAQHIGAEDRLPRRGRYAAVRYLAQKLIPLSWCDAIA